MSCAKTAEQIEMKFGMLNEVGPGKRVLHGVHVCTTWRIRFNGPCAVAMQPHVKLLIPPVVTFCVSRRRRKMYCGHARLFVCVSLCVCLSVCLSAAVRPHYCTDPDVTWGRGRGCPLVVHYWADVQSGYGLSCYGNIMRTLVTSLRPSRDMTT